MHRRHCLPIVHTSLPSVTTVHTSLPNTTTFTPLLFSTATITATALLVRLNVLCDLPLELRPQASPLPSLDVIVLVPGARDPNRRFGVAHTLQVREWQQARDFGASCGHVVLQKPSQAGADDPTSTHRT